ncbi:MAG: ribosomal L7Ae/L30e/S12e/Gadd45 family protein [Gemmatimonadaceae bacterium]
MDPTIERKMLGLVGLGVRARNVVVGVERVRDAAKRGTLRMAIVAPDASRNSLEKVVPMLTAKRIRTFQGPSAAALGGAVGRETTAAVGITNGALARGVRALLEQAATDATPRPSTKDREEDV